MQRKEDPNIDNEAALSGLFDWLIKRAIAFEKVFSSLVKKFKEQ
jgi:hypothetical protein